MKKLIILSALILFSVSGWAQRLPKYISANGFWVVETNLQQLKSNTVYFYNNNNELIYKERVEGVVLRLHKRRVKMNLKKVLDQSLLAYEQQKKSRENEMLLATLMSKR
ncbi:MAG: hypothetical protein EOO13_13115 [Chitinophagaceae bacterium]|nr:MAG: hypothetical protein EOO13_13115 [Chitinophagaceae bacterium]